MDHLSKVTQRLALVAILGLAFTAPSQAAKLNVGGFGLFGNAELRNSLRLLEMNEGDLTGQRIDDGAFLILTKLVQNGYLDAKIVADYHSKDGSVATASWEAPFEAKITEDVVATELRYTIDAGVLYYYDTIEIRGLASLDEEEALAYFIPGNALFARKKDRSYSPSILANQKKQLSTVLSSLGRNDAVIETVSVNLDRETGAADIVLEVEEGPLYKVAEANIAYKAESGDDNHSLPVEDQIYSRLWVEDQIRLLRNESYHLGYPDTSVSSNIQRSTREDGIVWVTLQFEVNRGPQIVLSDVEHIGATDTHTQLLVRKTNLEIGEPLDLTEVERARRRLSGLGIFNRIDLSYEPDGDGQREAIFRYENGQRVKAQLLLGYGSYESFRAGITGRRENLFGRAHTASFSAVKSVKSLDTSFAYAVPELLGETVDGLIEANYLDRQEISFERVERGVTVGLSKHFRRLRTDLGIDYAFERKRSSDPQFNDDLRLEDTNIGSIAFKATHNTLNNILYPTGGYDISGALRIADESLGGEANFIKPEFGTSYHVQFGKRWVFHTAIKGGFLVAPNSETAIISPNELFLVGGENSIRGYRRGEAGPLDSEGVPLGAEAFFQFNLEVEYPIFDKFNIVLFSDSARVWRSTDTMDDYDDLTSLGIGFRYNTIVGPVRLEYGHNLNPRAMDPDGTLHLSVGFPF